jgi:hypothetical protein
MAGTESTSKTDAGVASVETNKEKSTPETQVRTYFLPGTGESVQAASVEEAVKLAASKAKKGNEG